MTRPLTVEFIGICASGKSTTARQLLRSLRADGVQCPDESNIVEMKGVVGLGYSFGGEPHPTTLSRSQRWRWLARQALKSPWQAIAIIWSAALILPQLMLCGGCGRSVAKEAFLLRIGQLGDFDVVVWDEAVIHQVLASELEQMLGRPRLLKLFRRIYRDLNCVFVLHKIDAALAVRRYRDQPSRFRLDRRFTNDEDYYRTAEKDLRRHHAILDSVVQADFCAGRILTVDATGSVQTKTAIIQEFIGKLLAADKAQ